MPTFLPARTKISLNQWFDSPAIQRAVSSESFGWSSIVIECALNPMHDLIHSPVVSHYALVSVLQGTTNISGQIMGTPYDATPTPGAFLLLYPNDPATGRWTAPITSGIVMFAPELFTRFADYAYRGDPAHVRLSPPINFFDPLLFALVTALCRELHNTNPYGSLFADSVLHTMML